MFTKVQEGHWVERGRERYGGTGERRSEKHSFKSYFTVDTLMPHDCVTSVCDKHIRAKTSTMCISRQHILRQ